MLSLKSQIKFCVIWNFHQNFNLFLLRNIFFRRSLGIYVHERVVFFISFLKGINPHKNQFYYYYFMLILDRVGYYFELYFKDQQKYFYLIEVYSFLFFLSGIQGKDNEDYLIFPYITCKVEGFILGGRQKCRLFLCYRSRIFYNSRDWRKEGVDIKN